MMTDAVDALRGKRVLCAVSGGADSMCLLSLLFSRGIDVYAAHFEHGIRGEEAQRDAQFVKEWCAQRSIPCIIEHGDAPKAAKERGLSLETAARELRYEFLEKTADEQGCDVIATAHNADDNTETLIFNLTRGTGGAGLCGIPPTRGRIVRPLLKVTRAEIEEYLRENGIPHVEDSTNAQDEYSRNLIRHRVIPVLREINPALSRSAARTAELMARDRSCLEALADEFMEEYFDGESLPAQALSRLHPAIATRVIRKFVGGGVSMEQTDAILSLTKTSERGYADIPGRRVCCERGRLRLCTEDDVSIGEIRLVPGETIDIPALGREIRAEITDYGRDINGLFKTYCLRYENIRGDVTGTGRRNADKYRPRGRHCTKTLKSLFSEKGYTEREKNSALVFRDGHGILAVSGFPADERTEAVPGDRVLLIQIKKRD